MEGRKEVLHPAHRLAQPPLIGGKAAAGTS